LRVVIRGLGKGKQENISLEGKEDTQEGVRREKRIEEDNLNANTRDWTGPCKPKATITPQVVLNDPMLQAHREHMETYAVLCKFIGLWPMEKALNAWIKNHWNPKGYTSLHLGSKGFFTIVFTNIEDKDRVFKGGPFFYATTSLYMRPWVMNFVPKHETFTLVPVWVSLYSLPLNYWEPKSLKAL